MHKTLPYLALFAVVVLLQVFLFDNLSISIYLNPLVYVAFIALLPLDTPPVVLLLSGLATGCYDGLGHGGCRCEHHRHAAHRLCPPDAARAAVLP